MSRTILIVDDSKTERVVLNGFLRAEYDILEAESGETAIELLRRKFQTISAIVLDVVMPGMDGFETLRTIKANAVWLNIPVVITTGLDDEEAREKAVSYGADNFVTKPFNRKLLLYVVQNVIRLRETAAIANTLWRDKLTGLLNRESFFTEAGRMIRRHEPGYYVLSCFDVENFKIINDQNGSDIGDKVLLHIGGSLNGFVGGINGLACRYMADKFAILFPAAIKDSEAVRGNHEEATRPACLGRPLRIRIGRYVVNDLSLPVSTMFDRASMAESTVRGRYDTYIAEYTEAMREELLREQQIVNDMADALKNGEFEPWFQPQYNHATGALIGAEALVRWRKDGKIIPPNSFIPVFEKNGFIYEVDQSVWRQVCAHLRRWLDEGREPLPVSVNISRYDLLQKDFLDVICGLAEEFDLPADLLRLEITESAFSDAGQTIVAVVNELIERGFTVEIDDFGSGYSSLNTLKDVPASILKLDMKFFETTENSQRGGNIVESVVRMAKWLGMAVIAEGVEDKEQADYLKSIGCYYIQGYFYARPVPLGDYEARLADGAREVKLSRLQTLTALDNNQFWDPKSMDTFIFNSYVGAACILEYSKDRIEMLRATDYFATMLGSSCLTIKDALGLRWRERLDNRDLCRFSDAVMESVETREVVYGEFAFLDLPGCPKTTILRAGLRVIATAGERYLIYCQCENLTAQRTAEQREREAERKRLESAEQLEIIMSNINGSVSAILMDDVGNTSLIFGNDKYYEIFGYTKEQAEAIRLDTLSCIVPEDYDMVVSRLNQLKRDGVPVNIDYRAQRRDGSLIYIRSNSTRMSMEGYGDEVIVSVETDITEKRTLEDQLRAIVDNINGGVSAAWLKGDAPEFVLVNNAYFDIVGYTREQFEAEVANVFELVHPDDRDRVEKLFRQAAEDRKPYTMEYRILRRNGAVRHILCNTNVIQLFGMDKPVQLAVSNDITVLREAQQSEHDLSLQMQTIMENIRGGVTATVFRDKDNVDVVFSNEGFYEMYGYTREQLAAEVPNMLDLIVPEDREQTMETVARIARSRGCETYEYRCRKRDGSIMWTQVTNAVISMSGVGDTVLLAIVTDITALRRAELQSLEAMNRLQTVMNAMASGITAVAFRGDHSEFLFANDRYYELHGIGRDEYEQNELRESLALVHPDDRALMRELVMNTTELGQTRRAEYRILRPDGELRWAKVVVRVTRLVGVDVPVQVAVFTDITAEKEAAEQLRFLNDSAHDILAQPEEELAIRAALERINGYFRADRSYVVELDEARSVSRNTYEVCAAGVRPEKENLQDLPFGPSDWWFETLNDKGFMIIGDVDALGAEQAELRELLSAQSIRSILVVALRRDGRLIGFMGADNPANALGQVSQLTALADHIAVLLTRRDMRRRIERDRETMRLLMDDTPGGFLRMAIHGDRNPTVAGFNGGFCRMLGMSGDEVMAAYGENVYECLNAEDVAVVSADSAEARAKGGQFITKCRLRKKDGGFLWVMVSGRFVRDESGMLFLNAYFTDITERKNEERQQIELLDNLPAGAALYEYDGQDLAVIHINRRYWELVEREPVEYGRASVFGAIHPDDRAIIRQEIAAAIRQRRNADANARLLCGASDYRPFRITANITPKEDGRFLLYVSYTPISDEAMSVQELLPIALSTMIATTDDISYVKDKELRYLCVSQSIADMAGAEGPRDLVGKSAEEVFDAAFGERFTEDDRRILLTSESVVDSLEHIPVAGGGICLARTSKFPVLDASGRAVGVYCVSHDVTAQKEKESQLELLASSIPGGLAAYSVADGRITPLYFNDGFFRYSGYTREEYIALTEREPLALLFEEDRPALLAMVRAFTAKKEDGMTGSCTYRVRTKNGETRWMSLKAVLAQVGEDAYILNTVQLDVTDRMEVENRRRSLLDNLPFGAALFSFDGAVLTPIHINKQYRVLVNREISDSLEGFKPEDFIHPDDCQIVFDEVRDAIANGRNAFCEVRLLYGEGEYRTFRLDAKIAPESDGRYLLYVAYTRITEQEQSFKSLLPHMFSTIMEESTNLAFAKDVNFRYLCCSKTFAELLGLRSEKDVVGKTDYELFSKEIADLFRRDDSALFANGRPQVDVLEEIPSPDGTLHYTRTTKHQLRGTDGEILGVYCVGRDVTEIREAYAQLKLLTDSIPGGIATFRCRKGSIDAVYFNDGVCALAGYSREEYIRRGIPVLDLVFAEDRLVIHTQMERLRGGETSLDFTLRIHTNGGGYKWLNGVATASDRLPDDSYIVNAVLTDVTERLEEKERLRIAEEEYRIAARQSGHTIGRYDIAAQTMTLAADTSARLGLPESIPDVPYGRVRLGEISQDTEAAYLAFFERLARGEAESSAVFCKRLNHGWRWLAARGTAIFDNDGKPVSAIVSYSDVTEQQEKEIVYNKWQNSLAERPEESYSLFRCNLSRSTAYDSWTGKLLRPRFKEPELSFDERTDEYVEQCVYAEDRERFRAFMRADTMLAEYYRGHRSDAIEYRECDEAGTILWRKLTVDLVEYPNSTEVEAYLMFEDIDADKRRQLRTIERAETDPLTGVLNRATFAVRVNQLISRAQPGARHALLMLDIDGFKLVNDVFGHGAGDQTLTDVADQLTRASRKDDLVGRLGGDEFLLFLPDVPGEAAVAAKARQICEMTRKTLGAGVRISGSVGIALCPQDGESFESLYRNADRTLYRVKENGKNDYAFSGEAAKAGMDDRRGVSEPAPAMPERRVRRMLIADDSAVDQAILNKLFKEDYRIEKAMDGAAALAKIHHYGSAISVVLLDLQMPGMDGYAVLEEMRRDASMSEIPVIVVSADEHRETALKVIRAGAFDLVTKPVDPDILRIRVKSAVSRAENERLRALNSYLSLRNAEVNSYKSALERSGIPVITLDWGRNEFTYSPSVSTQLAGSYDGRNFWQALLSDMVADSATVQDMQQLVHDVAEDRERTEGRLTVRLKTASGLACMHELNVFKEVGDYGLANKMILTLREMPPDLKKQDKAE